MNALPHMVLGGAPKCGTTSLFHWLAQHPGVTASEPKETFYLIDEDSPFRLGRTTFHDDGLSGYSRFWPPAEEAHGLCVEGTTHYLYQRTARQVLASLPTAPHVAFILRDPAARVYSSFKFSQHMLARVDPGLTFARYLEIVQRDPDDLDGYVNDPRSRYTLKNDESLSRYIDHLEEWRALLPSERVHVFVFEQMKAEPLAFIRSFAERFGLEPSFFEASRLAKKNATVNIRSHLLHSLARRFSGGIPRNRATRWLYEIYLGVQRKPKPRPSERDEAALESLRERFAEPNRLLAETFALDLSSWEAGR